MGMEKKEEKRDVKKDGDIERGRYTKIGNKIGLFINRMSTVVLSFPFKDCILEGGMTKEEKNGGREERFFHEVIDKSEIDTLQDQKVLTNFSVINIKGEKKVKSEKDVEFFDEEGNLKNNLLIKGNNLLSLYSLRKKFGGKVKMIYIDPPYNTGNDTFTYNDNFNHSAWLVFIKNRLEVARDLLRDDGVIFISIDDNEQAYLKVLCDEIFGRERCEVYIWDLRNFEETSFTKTASKTVRKEHEYVIACYMSDNKNLGKYKEYRFIDRDDFSNPDNDSRGDWMSGNISRNAIKTTTGSKYFTVKTPSGKEYTRNWTVSKEEFETLVKDKRIYFSREGEGVPRIKIFKNEPSWDTQSSIFSNLKTSVTGKRQLQELIKSGSETFPFPKPVNIIQRLISIATGENDIVLDFFAGSGTTGHATLALNVEDGGNRRFILCEQIDEHFDICKERLTKVLKKSHTLFSKASEEKVIAFELKKYNKIFFDCINAAKTKEELKKCYRDMQKNAFLQFWFDKKKFEENGYQKLSLAEQKNELKKILDLNHMYLNYPDMEDATYDVAQIDKDLTYKFYE